MHVTQKLEFAKYPAPLYPPAGMTGEKLSSPGLMPSSCALPRRGLGLGFGFGVSNVQRAVPQSLAMLCFISPANAANTHLHFLPDAPVDC
jgi:hypothetical protein